MKIKKWNLSLIFFWISANLIALAVMNYHERNEKQEKTLAPNLVSKFSSLNYQIATPAYKTPITFHARLLNPRVIEEHRTYPLIVFLHGAGERGHDNLMHLKSLPQQMALPNWQEKFPCYLLAPQCPKGIQWSSPADSIDSSRELKKSNLLDQIDQMIAEVSENNPVDKNRIYITGYSMGGYGTWSMIARYPDLFAAASPICGGGDPNSVSKFVHLPLWVVHGDADQTVPVTESRKVIEALRKAGGTPQYYELKGVKHNSWSQTYNNPAGMLNWLFKQRKN